jgi:ABC-2 type transport system permease protein
MSTIDTAAGPHTFTAEIRRLRATRSTAVAVLVALAFAAALAVANVLLAGHQDNPPLKADALEHVIRAPAQVLGFVMLLVGVLAAAGEYRHGTVVASLLAQPRRSRWALAKLAAVARLGLVTATACTVLAVAVAVPLLTTQDAPAQQLGTLPLAALSGAVVAVGYGLVGVALGLLLRSQAAALTTALVWQFVVEGALPGVLQSPGMVRYLPGGAADSVLALGDRTVDGLLAPWAGVALFSAYAVGLLLVALVVRVPRDIR